MTAGEAMTAILADQQPKLTPEQYERFREYFYRRTGIAFGAAKREAVQKRVLSRMRQTKVRSFQEYFALLSEAGGREMQSLINALTVNETYFFREDYHLRCLIHSMLDELVAERRPGSLVRLWSLPCSTGEEPYSLAIALLEDWPLVDRYDVEIIGSDIDSDALAAAREGIYGARSLQYVSESLRRKYFQGLGDGRMQVIPALRNSIRFTRVNISETAAMKAYRSIDVVFCRNLLIYFDDVSRRRAAEAIYDCLRPGGFVCLGHSESMSRISSLFEIRKFPEAIVYQRPREG